MKRFPTFTILAALAFVLAAAGCATTATEPESESDRRITSGIRTALSSGSGFRFPDVNVRTVNGRVELTGAVPREELRELAAQISAEVAGVDSVMNMIVVRETGRTVSPTGQQRRGLMDDMDQSQ